MKKAISLSLPLLFVAAALFTGCGKYEEGPGLSLMSKKGRLAGTWTVEKATSTSGGISVDVTSAFANMSWTYEKDGTYKFTWGALTETGSWEFGDKKETVITTDSTNDKDTATIYRLKNKEFWTKDTYGSTTSEIHFKQ